jgi:transposase
MLSKDAVLLRFISNTNTRRTIHTESTRIEAYNDFLGWVDTLGLMLQAIVHAADIQDRDGGAMLMAALFGRFPVLLTLYGDGGYQGEAFQKTVRKVLKQVNVAIIKRSNQPGKFVVLPKRWIAERTLAWLNRCRRLAKGWESRNYKARAFLLLASIRRRVRNLCNPT